MSYFNVGDIVFRNPENKYRVVYGYRCNDVLRTLKIGFRTKTDAKNSALEFLRRLRFSSVYSDGFLPTAKIYAYIVDELDDIFATSDDVIEVVDIR